MWKHTSFWACHASVTKVTITLSRCFMTPFYTPPSLFPWPYLFYLCLYKRYSNSHLHPMPCFVFNFHFMLFVSYYLSYLGNFDDPSTLKWLFHKTGYYKSELVQHSTTHPHKYQFLSRIENHLLLLITQAPTNVIFFFDHWFSHLDVHHFRSLISPLFFLQRKNNKYAICLATILVLLVL